MPAVNPPFNNRYQLEASLEDMELIRQYIERRCIELNIDPSTIYDVQLAATELLTNSLLHGYQRERGWVEVQVEESEIGLIVYLRDHAPTFDSTQVPAPDLSLPLEKRRFGGMGIHFIRQLANVFEHRPLNEVGNEIKLIFLTSRR